MGILDVRKEQNSYDVEVMRKILLNYERARNEGFAPVNPELEEMLATMKMEQTSDANISLSGRKLNETETRCQEIIPEPFFVVKTRDDNKRKVFINICGSLKIAAPAEWEDGIPVELEKSFVNLEDDAALNLRFSLSCSDPVTSSDKCVVI